MTALNEATFAEKLDELVRRRLRRKRIGKKIGKALDALAVAVPLAFVNGWWLMMAVGIVHHEWAPSVPTIGYWWAALLCLTLRAALLPSTIKRSAP